MGLNFLSCRVIQPYPEKMQALGAADSDGNLAVSFRVHLAFFTPGANNPGELLDVDGMCGGYNLQWAWTSGYLAGKYAATD